MLRSQLLGLLKDETGFFDSQRVVYTSTGIFLVAGWITYELSRLGLRVDGIGGAGRGGHLAAAVSSLTYANPTTALDSFVVFPQGVEGGRAGQRVVLVSDNVVWEELRFAVAAVRDAGMTPVHAFALLDQGRADRTDVAEVPFTALFSKEDFE